MDLEKIKKLREATGAPIIECRAALSEAKGNEKKALEILRKKGLEKAAEVKEREEGKEGLIDAYIHLNGKIGVLIEVNCETDFVAKTKDFKELVHDLCLQIAATNPLYISPLEIPKEVLAKEDDNEAFIQRVCLLKQPFIKDQSKTVEDIISEKIAKLKENITIKRFARFELGG